MFDSEEKSDRGRNSSGCRRSCLQEYFGRKGGKCWLRLVQAIKNKLMEIGQYYIKHIYREANGCADAIANATHNSQGDVVMFEQSPNILSTLLFADVVGVSTPRLISL